jgi:hypothetical protein
LWREEEDMARRKKRCFEIPRSGRVKERSFCRDRLSGLETKASICADLSKSLQILLYLRRLLLILVHVVGASLILFICDGNVL